MSLSLRVRQESWPMREPFRLARGVVTAIDVIVAELTDADGRVGRGEAPGLPYEGETATSMSNQLAGIDKRCHAELTRERLLELLPRGGARNALDCALWDLEAKRNGVRAWQLAGMKDVKPVRTAVTLGLGTNQDFRRRILDMRHMPIIKIKVDRTRHVDLVRIAREEHPGARIIIDANQAWDRALLDTLSGPLQELGVELIEQPVPVGTDRQLAGYCGLPLAADESCTDRGSLAALAGLYQFVNIKLDKCGGLTEGLALAALAHRMGFGLMVGNMGGTSLSMAPHFVIAQQCHYADLDAPLIFRGDRSPAMRYEGSVLNAPAPQLWG